MKKILIITIALLSALVFAGEVTTPTTLNATQVLELAPVAVTPVGNARVRQLLALGDEALANLSQRGSGYVPETYTVAFVDTLTGESLSKTVAPVEGRSAVALLR